MARRREGLAGSLSPRSAVSPRSPRSPWTDSPRGSEVTDASGEMSGDLVQWLERKEQEQEQQLQQQPRATTFSWVLVFSANRDGKGAYVFTNMQEAWNIVERLVDVQLTISHVLSADGARIYLLVGAANRVLEDEAEVAMQLPVRMVLTKGVTPFQAEFKDNYVHSMHDPEGGVFNSAQKQQIVLHRIHRGLLITLTEQEWLWSPQRLLAKLRRRLGAEKPIRGELLRKIFTACGAFRTNAGALLGQTVEKAALVAHNDPFFSVYPPRREDKTMESRLANPLSTAVDLGADALRMGEDLVKDTGKIARNIARKAMGKQHTLVGQEEMEKRMKQKYKKLGLEVLTYHDCHRVFFELTRWLDSQGRTEKFTGSLKAHFPLHYHRELQFFRVKWANSRLLRRVFMLEKDNEGKFTRMAYYCDDPAGDGSEKVTKRQWAYAYQPIDEIRDYFGDSVALYFCWLGCYVKALVFPAVVGVLVTLVNATQGQFSPDDNPLTIPYSLFFAAWSGHFLAGWERKENELRFLWGNEIAVESQKPRPQYKGVLRVNFITAIEVMVDKSPLRKNLKMVASWCVISLAMALTASGALLAELLSQGGASREITHCYAFSSEVTNASCASGSWSLLSCKNVGRQLAGDDRVCRFEKVARPIDSVSDLLDVYGLVILSAVANLAVMMVAGALYNPLAIWLNDWENHRLQSTYDNHLVMKAFLFEFVNNYFVMFYITYLKQLDFTWIGFGKGHPCPESCMPDLQLKMLVIFTGKTYGLKVKEYGLPWIKRRAKKFWNQRSQRHNTAGSVSDSALSSSASYLADQNADARRRPHPTQTQEAGAQAVTSVQWGSEQLDDEFLKDEFPGTFDDFNQMAIQFGYLALFAPSCPLAPMLALLNNVTEIRTDAIKVCSMFRRPKVDHNPSIGSWKVVLQALAVAALLTNATMVAFVGSQLARGDYESERMSHRFYSARLWVITIVIEHSVMMGKSLIRTIHPINPRWVTTAREVLDFARSNMKTSEQLDKESLALFRKGHNAATYFDELDRDGSGYLDSEEVRRLCKKLGMTLGSRELLHTMAIIDTDGDGRVSCREFCTWWDENQGRNKYQLRDCRALFDRLDLDHSGYLDRREVGELCRQMGMKVKDPRALEKLFAELDTDENGEVSFEEFDSWWKANGGRRYRESMAAVSIGGARVASSSSGEVTAADGDREQTAEQPPTKGGLMSGMGSLLQRTTSGAMSAAGAVVGKLAAKVTESSSTDTISRASARSDLIIHQAMRASPTATTPSTTPSTTPNPLLVHTDAAAEGLAEEQGGPLPLIARLGHNLPLGSATSFETEHPLAAATAAPDVRSSNGLAATTAGRLVASPGAQPFTLIFRSQERLGLRVHEVAAAVGRVAVPSSSSSSPSPSSSAGVLMRVAEVERGAQAWRYRAMGVQEGVLIARINGLAASSLSVDDALALLEERPATVTFVPAAAATAAPPLSLPPSLSLPPTDNAQLDPSEEGVYGAPTSPEMPPRQQPLLSDAGRDVVALQIRMEQRQRQQRSSTFVVI